MRLLRRITLLLSLTLAICFIALWVRSATTLDTLIHRHTVQLRDPTVAEGTLGAWIIHTVQHTIGPERGSLRWTRSTTDSLRDSEPPPTEFAAFASGDGTRLTTIDPATLAPERRPGPFFNSIADFRLGGLGAYESAGGGSMHYTIQAPFWLLIAVSLLPTLWFTRTSLRRARRRRHHQCIHCGHDLTGAKVVCPECGKDLPSTH